MAPSLNGRFSFSIISATDAADDALLLELGGVEIAVAVTSQEKEKSQETMPRRKRNTDSFV